MGFKDYLIGALLVGLFSLALFAFVIQTQTDNNSPSSILNDPLTNSTYQNLNSSLTGYGDLMAAQQNASINTNPITTGFIIVTTIVTIPQKLAAIIIGVYDLIFVYLTVELGIPSIVLGLITTIILAIIIFVSFRIYRLGY